MASRVFPLPVGRATCRDGAPVPMPRVPPPDMAGGRGATRGSWSVTPRTRHPRTRFLPGEASPEARGARSRERGAHPLGIPEHTWRDAQIEVPGRLDQEDRAAVEA